MPIQYYQDEMHFIYPYIPTAETYIIHKITDIQTNTKTHIPVFTVTIYITVMFCLHKKSRLVYLVFNNQFVWRYAHCYGDYFNLQVLFIRPRTAGTEVCVDT